MENEALNKPIILSLCSGSGSWEKPYVESGRYDVIPITYPEYDVRLFPSMPAEEARGNALWTDVKKYENRVLGILAAPDCTYFSSAGNAWKRSDDEMLAGLSVVDACLRIAYAIKPKFFALENPIGKLRKFIGSPTYQFDPYEFGDMYSKRTYLWGWFNKPKVIPYNKNDINKFEGSPVLKGEKHREPMSGLYYKKLIEKGEFTAPSNRDYGRKYYRSITPQGFAKAFFEANQY
jgi:hypothetical protein